jgi:hypothetical protein
MARGRARAGARGREQGQGGRVDMGHGLGCQVQQPTRPSVSRTPASWSAAEHCAHVLAAASSIFNMRIVLAVQHVQQQQQQECCCCCCCCYFAAVAPLLSSHCHAHPAAAAANTNQQQQWQDMCHSGRRVVKQWRSGAAGLGLLVVLVVLGIPDTKSLRWGHFCVNADTHVDPKSVTT